VAAAKSALGTPYSWGAGNEYGATLGQPTGDYPYQATHTVGFDCSGLVQFAFAQVGITLPHSSGAGGQWSDGRAIPMSALRPGDLVFFEGTGNPQHVGIYIGSGEYIEAPHTGADVRISKLAGDPAYVGARRVIP
jgi:cell wall-associated NlpC family hydrolase